MMSGKQGVLDRKGWYVKALPSGDEWPQDLSLAPQFKQARVDTLPGALKFGVDKFTNKECMATRKLLARQRETVDGKIIEKLSFGEYTWRKYSEVLECVELVGSFMFELGFGIGDRISIFAETRADWFISAMGCLQQRVAVCTVYTTLSDDAIVHALTETEVKMVFTSCEVLPRLSRLLKRCPNVTRIVVMEDQLDGVGDTSHVPESVSITPFLQILNSGKVNPSARLVNPKSTDVAIIMYTSGSTGTPKGVELTHHNIISSVVAYSCQMQVDETDRYLSFLPLAHILELACEVALIALGITIYYSSPFTLTSSSPKIASGSEGDSILARPTYMNSVPLMLDRILKGVSQAVERQGRVKKAIFYAVVANKQWLDRIPFLGKFLDGLIFRKVRAELGGCLKRVVIGGAPLSSETHLNFRAIFGCTLQVGYGSTETASCISGMVEEDPTTGHCGGPCLNVFLRLADWEEGNYKSTDKPFPRGEVLIGGPCVARGYFKRPDETKETFFEEGGERWFRSGDIAEMDNLGRVRIIDRKKDLVKLKHGEYISLGNAEATLKTLNVVDNMCIFAESTRDKIVAVVVPVLEVLRKIATNVGFKDSDMTLEHLCQDTCVNNAVLKALQAHGRRCGLSRYEIPAAVRLTAELWTPDSGLVTAALKLRRKQLGQQYRDMVRDMYTCLGD
ncbi:long chain acyl-CoA synthetase 9, chloroplastic isoform X3 [Hyalella azteca]|uniref:long-chain-fatty-acid--CoA ligase n=1 Tax=Hyalella azteca TaxID=294128 RepID=A0A8B7PK83_HYAAZ|nr:long chain acyl-CoA synthetase 9, chloroplastic isoform X2 [Hyalella azteca]XP_047741623.1 long chain acyl-CoA synthetase 9, chloroplastic isoform X3 [Hyalella azteca]